MRPEINCFPSAECRTPNALYFSRRSFTLIELLVVIAILSLLMALLAPALKAARQTGRQAVCLSNVRQICLAVRLYCEDNEDTFPPYYDGSNYWPVGSHFREHYLNNPKVFRCPSMPLEPSFYGDMFSVYQTQYALNKYVTNEGGYRQFCFTWTWTDLRLEKTANINLPVRAALVGHSSYAWWLNTDRLDWPEGASRPKPHSNGVIVGFVDNHTEWMTKSTLDGYDAWLLSGQPISAYPAEARQFYFGEP